MGVSVILHDTNTVKIENLGHNFFLEVDDIGKNIAEAMLEKVQKLNTFAKVSCEMKPLELLDENYFSNINFVLLSNVSEVIITFY